MNYINEKISKKISNELVSCYDGESQNIPLYIETITYAAAMKMAELKDLAFSNMKNTLKYDVRKHTDTIVLSRTLFEKVGFNRYCDKIGTAVNKIEEIVDNTSTDEFLEKLPFCKELDDDEKTKSKLLKFMKWLEDRGFIKDDICYDTEHQVDTFVTQILPQSE